MTPEELIKELRKLPNNATVVVFSAGTFSWKPVTNIGLDVGPLPADLLIKLYTDKFHAD